MKSFIYFLILISSVQCLYAVEPIKIIINEENQKFSFTGLQFTPDGKYLINVAPDTRFRSVDTWEIVKSYPVGGNTTEFSKDGAIMVYDGITHITNLINLNTGDYITGFDGHPRVLGSGRNQYPLFVSWYAISNDNRFVVSVATDQQAILWNVETGEDIYKFDGFDEELGEITDFKPGPTVFFSDGSLVAFGNSFWSTNTFKKEFELQEQENTQYVVDTVLFNQSNTYFCTTANDGYLRIWDWENKSLLLKENFNLFVQKVEISFDDKYLVLIGNRNSVKIIDLANYKIISEFGIPAPGLGSKLTLSIHPNNEYLAVGGVEGKIYIYDLQEILASQSKIDDWVTYE